MLAGPEIGIEQPPAWAEAVTALVAEGAPRVMVVGATDAGKSSFARAALAGWIRAGGAARLLDTDPGQKMVGPPGAVTLGRVDDAQGPTLEALAFVGTTSAAAVREIISAAGALAGRAAAHPLIVNTSGLVRGPGVPLLLGLTERLGIDRLVAIGSPAELEPVIAQARLPTAWLDRAPAARRKGRAERARSRRKAFEAHLAPSSRLVLQRSKVRLLARPTICLTSSLARPVCALSDDTGVDLSLGILEADDDETLTVVAPAPARPVRSVRVGALWAQPAPTGWQLLDDLQPAAGRL